MLQRKVQGMLACALGLFVSSTALADGMRCGDDLVLEGDSTQQVRSTCGEPDAERQRVEYRTVRTHVPGPCVEQQGQRVCGHMQEHTITIVIDEWTYDTGPDNLVRFAIFEQGRLRDVELGRHGKKR